MMDDSNGRLFAITTALIVSCSSAACASETDSNIGESGESGLAVSVDEHARAEHAGAEVGGDAVEHEGDGEHEEGEHEEGEGEESGEYIARGDTWDATRRGARLVLTFDPVSDAFVGRLENTTRSMLCAVRVEVHLSSGTELGPTERTDVAVGQSIEVELPTGGEAFESWTAHPELSACPAE
ncbi:MAG: hypothetical protein OXI46_03560 [Gemmatimonadota bacterium]|nr:hypothetical protein [Gemmatimonadota bacterium]